MFYLVEEVRQQDTVVASARIDLNATCYEDAVNETLQRWAEFTKAWGDVFLAGRTVKICNETLA